MIFNENLISHFKGEKHALAKYILFSIKEDIRLDSALTNRVNLQEADVKMKWKEDILGDAQEILIDLIAKGTIVQNNYEQLHSRYSLMRPLYVHSLIKIELSDDFIALCRMPFFKAYCKRMDRNSSASLVRSALITFIEKNEVKDISLIPKALRYMVDERMKDNPDFVTKLITFIDPLDKEELDGKNLKLYLEEYEQYNKAGGNNSLTNGIDI